MRSTPAASPFATRLLINHAGITRRTRRGLCAGVLAGSLLAAGPASAIDWVNGLSFDDFNDPTAWVGGAVPGPGDTARFLSVGVNVEVRYNLVNPMTTSVIVNNSDVILRSFSGQQNTHTTTGNVTVDNDGNLTLGTGTSTPLNLAIGSALFVNTGGIFEAVYGSDVTASFLSIATNSGSPSVVTITDPGTTLNVSGTTSLGLNGATGTLNFSNGSSGNVLGSAVLLADSGIANSTGILNVTGSSQVTTGNIEAGNGAVAGQAGTILVDGAGSSITQSGGSTLTLGASSNSTGQLTVTENGVFNTGTGTTTINATGTVDLSVGGDFNVNGDLDIIGGTLNNNATFRLAANRTMTVSNDGQVAFGNLYDLDDNTTFTFNTGADFNSPGYFDIGNSTDGTLVVDGPGTTFTFNGSSFWGSNGATSSVTVSNNAVLTAGGTTYVGNGGAGTTSIVTVQSGGDMNVDVIRIGGAIAAAATSTFTVTGSGSTVTQGGSFIVVVGNDTDGTGTLNIAAGGVFTTGTGPTTINDTGVVNVTGTNSVFEINGNLDINAGSLQIDSNALVTVAGSTFVDPGSSITIGGNGRFEFGNISPGDYGLISGTSGSLAGDVVFSGLNPLSSLTPDLNVHTDLDTTDVHLVNDGLLFGNGIAQTSLTNLSTRQAQVAAGERMVFAGGLDNAGTLTNTGGQFFFAGAALNQTGATIEGRGLFTANGGWTSDGAFNFSGGFADVQGDVELTANATVNTAGNGVTTFLNNLDHDGTEVRTEAGSKTVVFGLATGPGSYTGPGTVEFVGGYSPGASPAVVNFAGELELASTNTLTMELGGTTPGTGYDKLEILGDWSIDGILDVVLINAFTPSNGDSFDLFDFGSVTGTFDTINLPTLAGNLQWDTSDLYIDGTLSVFASIPADLDGDGDVDGVDLSGFFANFTGPGGGPPGNPDADLDGDGDVDGVDLSQAFSAFTGPLAPANVPEPATVALLLLAAPLWLRRR